MKILILLSYFNRPLLVRNALNSVKKANEYHQDWELAFGDDSSPIPGEPIVREILADHLDKVTFHHTNMTLDEKLEQGIVIGRCGNEAMKASNAEIVITLGDDDELVPTYLRDISEFFTDNPEVMYCWSNIHIYNPLIQKSEGHNNITGFYNSYEGAINPVNKVDASQVAFRMSCDVKFPETTLGNKPWINNIDGGLFQQLFNKFGPAVPSNIIAQYKGIHDYQLVWHKKKGVDGLIRYITEVTELGGKRF